MNFKSIIKDVGYLAVTAAFLWEAYSGTLSWEEYLIFGAIVIGNPIATAWVNRKTA